MNNKEIIERGYALEAEYNEMVESSTIEKMRLVAEDGFAERLWIYPLEDSGTYKKFHFVFLNDPIMFMGAPRPPAGMVGIAHSNGTEEAAIANRQDCLDLFKKTGMAAIDYHNECLAKLDKKPTNGKGKNEKNTQILGRKVESAGGQDEECKPGNN